MSGSTSRRRPSRGLRDPRATRFSFHALAVEDALAETHQPEDRGCTTASCTSSCTASTSRPAEHHFATHDVDFFLGPNYLVTVHDGQSRSIAEMRGRRARATTTILAEGPCALMHRIVDAMVDHYRPGGREARGPARRARGRGLRDARGAALVREILGVKRDVSVAAPRHHAAARRRRPPRAARVRRHQRRDVVPVPRRLRPPRAAEPTKR